MMFDMRGILLALPLVYLTGVSAGTFEERIIGGADVPHTTPVSFTVSVWWNTNFVGGGVIVAESWVLTSASIVYGYQDNLLIKSNSLNLLEPITFHVIEKSVHSSYKNGSLGYDVALLKVIGIIVGTPVDGYHPPVANEAYSLYGWGYHDDSQSISIALKTGSFMEYSVYECAVEWNVDSLPTTTICVISDPPTPPCHGDEGSPLVLGAQLVGIVTKVSCVQSKSAIVTNANNLEIKSWIDATVGSSQLNYK